MKISLLFAGALLSSAISAQAATVTDTLPETNVFTMGPFVVGTFIFPTFNLSDILSVNLTGAYGNATFGSSSANSDVVVDGVVAAQCGAAQDGFGSTGCNAYSFSYDFDSSDFGLFTDGEALVTGDFVAGGAVRLSELTLTIETDVAPVPLPAAGFLMAGALGAMGLVRRRRKQKS